MFALEELCYCFPWHGRHIVPRVAHLLLRVEAREHLLDVLASQAAIGFEQMRGSFQACARLEEMTRGGNLRQTQNIGLLSSADLALMRASHKQECWRVSRSPIRIGIANGQSRWPRVMSLMKLMQLKVHLGEGF